MLGSNPSVRQDFILKHQQVADLADHFSTAQGTDLADNFSTVSFFVALQSNVTFTLCFRTPETLLLMPFLCYVNLYVLNPN